jgi:hypothetical protein
MKNRKTLSLVVAAIGIGFTTALCFIGILAIGGCKKQSQTSESVPTPDTELVDMTGAGEATLNAADSLSQTPSSWILASAYGPRNSWTLTNILNSIGSRRIRLILDGGDWIITNKIVFPTNVGLEIVEGARLSITSAISVGVMGQFYAGAYPAFTGPGSATGSAQYLYRYSQWGSVTQYNIGAGILDSALHTNTSFTMIAATTGTFGNVVASNTTISQYLLMQSGSSTAQIYNLQTYFPALSSYRSLRPTHGTISLTTNMTEAAIRTKLAEYYGAFVPPGHLLTIQFADGTYQFTNGGIGWLYAEGGGDIYWRGNTNETIGTNKAVVLDFSSGTGGGLALQGEGCRVQARNLHIKWQGLDCDDFGIGLAQDCEESVVFRCFIEGDTTNAGTGGGIFTYGGRGVVQQSYFKSGYNGIYAINGARIELRYANWAVATDAPLIGIRARSSIIWGQFTNQIQEGTWTNAFTEWGGIIQLGQWAGIQTIQ